MKTLRALGLGVCIYAGGIATGVVLTITAAVYWWTLLKGGVMP